MIFAVIILNLAHPKLHIFVLLVDALFKLGLVLHILPLTPPLADGLFPTWIRLANIKDTELEIGRCLM